MTPRSALAGFLCVAVGWIWVGEARAAGPTWQKVEKEVAAYWKAQWPDQVLAHVSKKTDCEKSTLDDPTRKDKQGNPRKIQTCLIKADIMVEKGWRLLIYRDTFLHFVAHKLKAVQLGELDKKWKADLVPPTPEQVASALAAHAAQKLGAPDAQVNVREISRHTRKFGEDLRASALVDVRFTKDGAEQKREGLVVTFQTDGGDWTLVPDLAL